jgi:vitamin B12 transporter
MSILFSRWQRGRFVRPIQAMVAMIVLPVTLTATIDLPCHAQTSNTADTDIDIEVFSFGERQLQKPIYAPFRQEGTLRDATRPAYVITQEEIKAQGARNAREALRLLPGILNDGTVGSEVNALSGQFMRGAATNRVSILLDGRAINNAASGGFDISEIPAEFIDRLEVLPGGGSTLYGSDAIGGIINIITAKPTTRQQRLTGRASLAAGDLGYNQQHLTLSGRQGSAGWLGSYTRVNASNTYNYTIPEANFSGTRQNNATTSNNFRLYVDNDIDSRSRIYLHGIYFGKIQGVPGGVPVPTPLFGQGYFNSLTDRNQKITDQYFTDFGWERRLGNGSESILTARVYYDNNSTIFDSQTTSANTLNLVNGQPILQNTPQNPSQFINRQQTLGFQAQHAWQFAPNQQIVYGFDYRLVNART